jgi:alpha-tubulin suppressor-like RCC1 family protein
VYSLGFNKYGQLGISNSMYAHVEDPIEVFTDNLKIVKVAVGSHHALLMADDGRLYGFGARMNGQLDGTSYGKTSYIS